jgi:hypothetical protein
MSGKRKKSSPKQNYAKLDDYYNMMINHKRSSFRRQAYLTLCGLMKNNAKGFTPKALEVLLKQSINAKMLSTNVLHLIMKYCNNLLPHIYLIDDSDAHKYVEEKGGFNLHEVKITVALYLQRKQPSSDVSDHVSSFLIEKQQPLQHEV